MFYLNLVFSPQITIKLITNCVFVMLSSWHVFCKAFKILQYAQTMNWPSPCHIPRSPQPANAYILYRIYINCIQHTHTHTQTYTHTHTHTHASAREQNTYFMLLCVCWAYVVHWTAKRACARISTWGKHTHIALRTLHVSAWGSECGRVS